MPLSRSPLSVYFNNGHVAWLSIGVFIHNCGEELAVESCNPSSDEVFKTSTYNCVIKLHLIKFLCIASIFEYGEKRAKEQCIGSVVDIWGEGFPGADPRF